jgi:hypothetical protein
VLRSIKELEFDQAMGKLAQSDFDEMSERLRARALGLMRQLDATHAAPRERIERELADRLVREARRSGGTAAGASAKAAPPVVQQVAAAVACEACGTSNDADARFCKECGTRLAKGAAHA